MTVNMPAPVTRTLTIPITISATEAVARLRAAEASVRSNPHWLVPTGLTVDWLGTTGTISGVAYGFAVDGTIVAADDALTVALTVPWTAKALHDSFAPRLETALQRVLA